MHFADTSYKQLLKHIFKFRTFTCNSMFTLWSCHFHFNKKPEYFFHNFAIWYYPPTYYCYSFFFPHLILQYRCLSQEGRERAPERAHCKASLRFPWRPRTATDRGGRGARLRVQVLTPRFHLKLFFLRRVLDI